MIEWFARNHVAANLLMITILVTGFIALTQKNSLEVFPDIDLDRINISAVLPGATPEDIEEGVAMRLEESIQDLEGIKKVTSRSVEGSTTVSVDIDPNYDGQEMLAEIKNRVDAINTLPTDVERPVVQIAQHRREVITVTVSGNLSEKEIREFAEHIRDDLLRNPNITLAELNGVRNYEVDIQVAKEKLNQYGLTLIDVSNAIAKSSLNQSAGNIKSETGEILIRAKSQSYRKQDFENIVIKTNVDGSILRLGDVANVNDGFEETPMRTRYNGVNAAVIDVYRVGKQNAIELADTVKHYIEAKKASLPAGIHLDYWDDRSRIVKSRLHTLTSNAMQGGILVFILLTLFLRPAIAFWVFVGIPISFMGAFIFMPYLGVTVNIISLFGFILVLGIVVDDAIVTGENVYRHMRNAESGLHAAIHGTKEVAVPVTFGVLTTVAAFIPFFLIEGQRGALFAQIPAIIIPVLLFSLLESKLVLPAHLKHINLVKDSGGNHKFLQWQQSFATGFENFVFRYYRPALNWCLKFRYATLVFFFCFFVFIIVVSKNGWIHFVFFPRIQSETVSATLTMPVGTAFEVTDRYISKMADAARQLQDKYRDPKSGNSVIISILSSTGSGGWRSSGSHLGQVRFEMEPPERRDVKVESRQLLKEWQQRIGSIPGSEALNFRAEIGRGGEPIDIQLSGNSLQQLKTVAEAIKQRLATYPSIFDITDSLSAGKEELRVNMKEQGLVLGLTPKDIIEQVRSAFLGAEVQRIQRGREDVKVYVRFPRQERSSLSELKGMLIKTRDGRKVPLDQVAELVADKGPSAIYRTDFKRTVDVTADIDKKKANMIVINKELVEYLDDLLAGYPDIYYNMEGEAREQGESFHSLQIGIVFVLFVIYCLLAIPFRSYSQPLIVMSVIPLGVIGAILGHWIMGMDLSIMSLLGLLALTGVVVNDSLVLVDFVNKTRTKNDSNLHDVILDAGVVRFRPIMLTSATTFIGLVPLLFEKSTQAQFLIPMAVSLGFGVVFATVITLVMVPANYLIIEDIQQLLRRVAGKVITGNQTG